MTRTCVASCRGSKGLEVRLGVRGGPAKRNRGTYPVRPTARLYDLSGPGHLSSDRMLSYTEKPHSSNDIRRRVTRGFPGTGVDFPAEAPPSGGSYGRKSGEKNPRTPHVCSPTTKPALERPRTNNVTRATRNECLRTRPRAHV